LRSKKRRLPLHFDLQNNIRYSLGGNTMYVIKTALALGVAALCATGVALAQSYPTKTITIVVSYPAGGDTDALGRVFAEKLGQRLNSTVVVENKPGASGTIGNAFVAKSAPDGHTLLLTPSTISTALTVLKPGTGGQYDTINDFTPIIQVGTQPLFFVANTASGIKSVKDIVEGQKAGKFGTYGSPGSGSPMHILGEMFNKSAGVKIQQVPYRGSAPAVNDLLGGQISWMPTTLGPVRAHIASGKMVNLGVADAKRSPLAPDVPTLAELGYKDAELGAWQGVMAPKGTPEAIVKLLNTHLNEIIKMPDVAARLNTIAVIPTGGEPSALDRAHRGDNERLGKVIQELKIQAD
jgi:tripartite-type tricarboxylate transporter receptor subunit TctC